MQRRPEDTADLLIDLLADQRSFYRTWAPEYDEWWQRRGRYDDGPEDNAEWDRQIRLGMHACDTFAPVGAVLELAGGTGWWSPHLARTARTLTVLDSSSEALRLNCERV